MFQFVTIVLALGATVKSLALPLCTPSVMRSSLSLLFSTLSSHRFSQPFLIEEVLQVLHHCFGPSLYSFMSALSSMSMPLSYWEARTGPEFQVQSQKCQAERKDHLPHPAGDTWPNTAKNRVSLLSSKGTLLAPVQLCICQCSSFPAEQLTAECWQCVLVVGTDLH